MSGAQNQMTISFPLSQNRQNLSRYFRDHAATFLRQFVNFERHEQESVIEIGMGQHLTKGPGPFAKPARIFRRSFANVRDKFPNLAE